MDVSAPTTPLIMEPFGKGGCQSPSAGNAFEFDFVGGNFFNSTEEDDILSSLYNKTHTSQTNGSDPLFDNTFTSLSTLVNEKSLPDSPDSWISNSSTSDNECEDLELCEFISENNVQKVTTSTKKRTKQQKQQPPVMTGSVPPSFLPNMQMNYPVQFQQGMMDPYALGAQAMMPMPMMSPQQLMFLQQQQQAFNTFNAMNFQPANFVPAPVPQPQQQKTVVNPKKSTTPPVKAERASPKITGSPAKGNMKRRRENTSPEQESVKSEGKNSPIVDSDSNHSSPTSSPSSSPTPMSNENSGKPGKDKDVKRQRRLIKNRESAQASRERKKVYVQGLEKRVDDLAQTNNVLNTKVLTLEEENILLREKLLSMDKDGSLMREINEPNFKKRRLAQPKIPIPSLQAGNNSMNPFAGGFWNAFMGFAPPSAQNNPAWSGAQSKKVVLFVVLFCVAVLVMSGNKEGITTVTTSDGSQSICVPQLEHRRIQRNVLKYQIEDIYANITKYLNETKTEEQAEEDDAAEEKEASPGAVSIEHNKEKNTLVLSFPVEKLTGIKSEPGTESVDSKMDQFTKELMSTICSAIAQ